MIGKNVIIKSINQLQSPGYANQHQCNFAQSIVRVLEHDNDVSTCIVLHDDDVSISIVLHDDDVRMSFCTCSAFDMFVTVLIPVQRFV